MPSPTMPTLSFFVRAIAYPTPISQRPEAIAFGCNAHKHLVVPSLAHGERPHRLSPRVPSISRIGGLKSCWLWFDRSPAKAYALMNSGEDGMKLGVAGIGKMG